MKRQSILSGLVVVLACVCATAHAAGTWTPTGSMGTARQFHTATLLQNGKVLIAGGESGSGCLASAELHDPVTGMWSVAGSLATARYWHTATLLPSGKVLVVGGAQSIGVWLSSAELYDPGTNTWTVAGSLAAARINATATLLASGKVLVAGGYNGAYLTSAELYDPGTNTWSVAGSLANARRLHTATLLPNGKVLVVAGGGAGGAVTSAELYDPGTDTWSAGASLVTARQSHTATLLPGGKVLVAGGWTNTSALASAELYDPGTNTWSAAGTLATARDDHTATLLPSGKVLVAGGDNGSAHFDSGELYDPGTDTWSATGSLAAARCYHTATLLPSGKVLVAGGWNGGYLASAEVYDYAAGNGSWSATGSLATARQGPTATLLPNGKVLVAAGYYYDGPALHSLASSELYDPGTSTWSAAGSLTTARLDHTATVLPSGKVLFAGGRNGSVWLASAELYDSATSTWSAAGSLATTRGGHTMTLLPSGKVLVAGGWNSNDGYLASAELYDPATNTWNATGSMTTTRYQYTATLLPSGKVLVAGGWRDSAIANAELFDPATNTWSAVNSLATARNCHTATLLPSGKVLVVAGNGNGGVLASAELYDPATDTWSAAGSFPTARCYHTATLLPSGKVLVAGGLDGSVAIASAELYDPGTNTWTAAGSLATARGRHTATLLASGKVLVAGGNITGDVALASAELFDPGLGYQNPWRPVISSATSPLGTNGKLVLGGSGFKGISEASGGGYQSSATNYPLVQLRSLVNDQTAFLLSDPTSNWSNTEFVSAAVSGFPKGYAAVTVFTNGIPSESKTILISDTAPTITSALTASGTMGASFTYQITATNSPTSYGATNLPGGLSVDAAGAITGTAETAGATDVTISATNAGGTGSATLRITISTQAPSITSSLTATGTVGQSFSYEITASGTTPITYSAQPLPAGLTFSGNTISGTPTTEGATYVTLEASNTAGSDSKELKITVNPSGAPTITSALTAAGQVGQTFSYTILASGNAPITFSATDLPAWLSFSTDTLSGTPPATGTFSVSISAANTSGTDTKTLEITINAAGAPTITSALTASGKAGTTFSYQITAAGTGTITYGTGTLPGWLSLSGALLSGTPQPADVGTVRITITAANELGTDTKELQITIGPANGDPPVVTDIYRSRNPVRTNTPVTFVAEGVAPSGQPLSYRWYFFDSAGKQAGAPQAGKTVTFAFPLEDNYTVVAVGNDGFRDSTNFTKVSVTLAPNSGSDAANVTVGVQVANPNGGLGISVPGSVGGVVDLDLVDVSVGADRADEAFQTRIPTLPDAYDGRALAGKFSVADIFVVEATGTKVGGQTRKARIMVPLGKPETGEATAVVDQRVNKGLVTFDMKGKFTFGQKLDGVTLKSEIELAAGLTPSQGMPISVGIGNVAGSGSVDSKGRVTGMRATGVKKVQVKWPRLDKKDPVTKGGEKAKVTISLMGANLDLAGFDTEGVVNTGVTEKQALPRQIQTAIVLGGVSYYAQASVNYILNRGTGMLQGRTAR